MPNRSPAIIVLNEASSSSKTLAGQALMKLLGPNCILIGFDDILERVKPFGAEGGRSWSGFQRMLRIMSFQLRDGRLQLFKKLHREVVASHQAGHDVILETVLMDRRALHDAALCFSSTNAIFVGMKPPLEVSEEWETKRNDRPAGQDRKHYDLVHAHGIYDLILDPSKISPEECATTILDRLSAAWPNAFQRILKEAPGKNAA
ncbi:MAG: chloramphenicol phosphotransferase CPT family protein [Chloroflexales bacterium]|nr:chloramphenicol phosphotransferase CPT family protein [Chloroflexales bacterium]